KVNLKRPKLEVRRAEPHASQVEVIHPPQTMTVDIGSELFGDREHTSSAPLSTGLSKVEDAQKGATPIDSPCSVPGRWDGIVVEPRSYLPSSNKGAEKTPASGIMVMNTIDPGTSRNRQCTTFIQSKGRQCVRWANEGDVYCCVHLASRFTGIPKRYTLYCDNHIPSWLKRARNGRSRIVSKEVFLDLLKGCYSVEQKLHLHQAFEIEEYPSDYQPDWGVMSFLIEFLRRIHGERSAWYNLLMKAGGGCNDLIYSGHMFVVVLTSMAWTKAKGYDVSKVLLIINVASKWRLRTTEMGGGLRNSQSRNKTCTPKCSFFTHCSYLLQESLVAAFSLLCISHNLRKYGVRKFLFVDLSHGHSCAQLDSEYANKINVTAIGLVICLHVATKVSHRAQGIVSVATRWHSVSTNEITSQMEVSSNGGGMEAPLPISLGLLPPNLLGDLFGGSRTIIWASMIGVSDPFFNHPEDYV
ncbi:Histone-lysine N-methyltransferase SUVR5, partial [Linum perenne]